jgi:hypothetical protein
MFWEKIPDAPEARKKMMGWVYEVAEDSGYSAGSPHHELFYRTYDEALSVAIATGDRPEKMLVDPIPPGWNGRSTSVEEHDLWLVEILNVYGDAKASMLQDFERARTAEIDFINGYVVDTARQFGLNTPANTAIVETVYAITRGQCAPESQSSRTNPTNQPLKEQRYAIRKGHNVFKTGILSGCTGNRLRDGFAFANQRWPGPFKAATI